MTDLFGIPLQLLLGQSIIGLINGSFYALLSLGLALIFGLLNIVNFAHGALFMLGAYVAWGLLAYLGIGYWPALMLAPLIVAALGAFVEKVLLKPIAHLDHPYSMILTFGLMLLIEGVARQMYGASGLPYQIPEALRGTLNLGFMYLPIYRGWVIAASALLCLVTWFVIERTKIGSYLRAATHAPVLVEVFGINVPLMVTLTYAAGAALAAFGGVLAAPIYSVNPLMGSNVITIVFAVIVIGGMGSITGSIITGFALGLIEGLTKVFYPPASSAIIYVIMIAVLLIAPTGLFGKEPPLHAGTGSPPLRELRLPRAANVGIILGLLGLALVAPAIIYPGFLMKALCFALLACAFNLLMGYCGLVSFGHAAFFGSASYITAYTVKSWGLTPELGIVAGVAVATALGVVFGWLSIRRKGIYFAMITLALSQLIYFIAVQAPFTGGEDGIQGVPRGKVFGLIDISNIYSLYYFVLVMFLIGLVVLHRTVNSPFGRILKAIRENEPRAVSLGYNVQYYKLLAFVISTALAGLAGSTKTFVFQFVSLNDVFWGASAAALLMTILGGVATLMGPVVGAFVVITMEHFLAPFGSWVVIIQGAAFVVCVLVFRSGIVGEIQNIIARRMDDRKTVDDRKTGQEAAQ